MSAIELFEAAKHGNASRAKTALRNGADVAARDEDGSTPLHVAARVSAADHRADPMATVAALIEAGADPGARTRAGATPLHAVAAARHDNSEVVEALLEAGADPSARDEDGKTPFDYEKEHNGASWEDGAYWRLSEARFA